MVIDRERVKQAFQEYTGRYDIHDEKIRLKVEHTYRVADISEQIAEKLGLSEEDIALECYMISDGLNNFAVFILL